MVIREKLCNRKTSEDLIISFLKFLPEFVTSNPEMLGLV